MIREPLQLFFVVMCVVLLTQFTIGCVQGIVASVRHHIRDEQKRRWRQSAAYRREQAARRAFGPGFIYVVLHG